MASISSPMQGSSSLFSLLPQAVVNQTNVQKVLNSICLITRVTRSAIEAFLGRELALFDALVGEEACHIRAVKVHELSMRLLQDPTLQHALQVLNTKINEVEQKAMHLLHRPTDLKKKENITMGRYLQMHGMDIEVSADLLFLIESRLLTLSKIDAGGKDRTDCATLQKMSGLSASNVSDLVKHVQKHLSELSVGYIQECAEQKDIPHIAPCLDEGLRSQVPCFFALDMLLHRMHATEQPLLIKVVEKEGATLQEAQTTGKKMHFLFHPENGFFHRKEDSSLDTTAVVVEGNCLKSTEHPCFEEKMAGFAQEDIGSVILANAAQHTQYAGQKLTREPVDLPGLDSYKQMAYAGGFSLTNPSVFCIEHIFADTIRRHVESI